MKKCIQLSLYCIALAGIGIGLFFEMKAFGITGYVCLIVASILQIVEKGFEKSNR